jgi:hypothetical protein
MTSSDENGRRRLFASKYSRPRAAWTFVVIALYVLSQAGSGAPPMASVALAVVFALAATYCFRGKGHSPARQASLETQKKAQTEKILTATKRLNSAKGGEAVVAYRELASLFKAIDKKSVETSMQEAISSLDFDLNRLKSVEIGTLPKFGMFSDPIEVYEKWIIHGKEWFDVEPSTRGEVHVDGSITFDSKNNKRDLRKASMTFVSKSWSKTFQVDPDKVDLARRIVAQLATIMDSSKPAGVTAGDISQMLELILSNTGQPAAEKLQQLSDLRFQRLLSDDEFEAAKAKVLGI